MITVKIVGLEPVLAKLKPSLYAAPLRRFWEWTGLAVLAEAKKDAPVDTGRLTTSLNKGGAGNLFQTHGATPPLWVKIGTNVNARGFSYPRALDESPRYHYWGGRAEGRTHAKATGPQHAGRVALYGRQTLGYFSKAPERARQVLDGLLDKLANEIIGAWRG